MRRYNSTPGGVWIKRKPSYTNYIGMRDELIRLGHASPDMFPDGNKRRKYHLDRSVPDKDKYSTWRLKGGIYSIRRWHDPRDASSEARANGPEDFRNELVIRLAREMALVMATADGRLGTRTRGETAYRFDSQSLERLTALREEIFRVLQEARVQTALPATDATGC